jgi:hypothetical protein
MESRAGRFEGALKDKPSRIGENVESVAGMRGVIVSISAARDFHVRVRWENGYVGSISRANLKTREMTK